MPKNLPPSQLIPRLLAGDRLALSRAISRLEEGGEDARALLAGIFPHTGRAHLIGITGAPGTGKSTLVTGLVQAYRAAGMTVAVLAVDPTSPFTGGALLGDRVRMSKLSGDSGVFVRSMATRGSLGGLAAAAADALLLLDAAGYQRILIETVGVGQAEVEIAGTAHTTVVVEAPGLGDEVQAIKAGVLEIGDIFVVNKADRPGVARTVGALELMLHMAEGTPRQLFHHGQLLEVAAPAVENENDGWPVQVFKTVAVSGGGIPEVMAEIERHRMWLAENGRLAARERLRMARSIEQIVQAELLRRLRTALPADSLAGLVEEVAARTLDPYAAAERMLAQMG
ncbi:MAG: methylmalonyl Co-A mutase-associated GTPase MeaB [Caldilineaceae bacterium]|nr:methylmalonyl Co-A mutase-associated GTPase MeaB [Caldilineaceae bacterium]